MEEVLKNEMELEYCKKVGSCAGTNQSIIFETDRGKMFVKICETRELAEGELESLKFIRQTGSIRCPAPFCTIKFDAKNYGLVTEFLEMENSGRVRNETKLAEKLARSFQRGKKEKRRWNEKSSIKRENRENILSDP
ncbi:unnamed protein product [Caenorhabditis angaria]|uniref:Protein kinase domain-containing protein n=1 Tax=Caenorhabditis angaria TaxID=860376 RepID=A0A9P1N2H4_9PELO|nr:unnamed protein product [Caenorhabditis angaria]